MVNLFQTIGIIVTNTAKLISKVFCEVLCMECNEKNLKKKIPQNTVSLKKCDNEKGKTILHTDQYGEYEEKKFDSGVF